MSEDFYSAAREISLTVVMHPEFQRVLDAAGELIDRADKTGEPLGLIVTAEPGMGKSVLLKEMARRVRHRYASLSNNDPVLSLEFDAMVDTFKVASGFLESLGYPVIPQRTKLETMTSMVDTALSRLKPHVACVDEAQHSCEGCRDITARATTDWLKRRMDKNCLSFVLAGTPVLSRLRQINPQFASRASADFVINTFTYGAAWHQLLKSFIFMVKSVDLGILEDKKTAHRTFDGAQGNLRRVKRWLSPATVIALSEGRKELTRADLQRGFKVAFGDHASVPNPFEGES